MDATTIIVSIVGSSFFSAILAPFVQHSLQREERKRTEEQHTMKMQQDGMDIQEKRVRVHEANVNALHQATIDFPFLTKYISEMPQGLSRIETGTGNVDHPIVLVEKEAYSIKLSWSPKDIKGHY